MACKCLLEYQSYPLLNISELLAREPAHITGFNVMSHLQVAIETGVLENRWVDNHNLLQYDRWILRPPPLPYDVS